MSLLQLPNELQFIIARCLLGQKEIGCLMRTNKRLYHLLRPFLLHFNVEYDQSSALIWAAKNGATSLIKELLDIGSSIASFEPELTDPSYDALSVNNNPLLHAAQNGHIDTLQSMLSETRTDKACVPSQLRTVLHWAIRSSNSEMVELMITQNAPFDPSGRPMDESNALSIAITSSSTSIIKRLLQAGAQTTDEASPNLFDEVSTRERRDVLGLLLEYDQMSDYDQFICWLTYNAWMAEP
ncbi:hypothetical protein N7447_009659 [Penicillium robsamsonii]|uniref:uncharacterized protein n=1 Tax=Penicillium robsamsonii TaxID=1792511 RepID=UPI002547045E|nr:uncharacterized protein N7447_009659 [Penicillium robsamsonii]KAJ5817426.1 hypothetical protein N7447_009659 [Penicillium robsamsonii]